MSIKIAGIADDTIINSIGSYFCKDGASDWGINIDLYPKQRKKSLSVSQAPILIRRNIINQLNLEKKSGYHQALRFSDNSDWNESLVEACPALQNLNLSIQSRKQKCFLLEGSGKKTFYLPQLELARVLFFHNAYLSRAALSPEILDIEFQVSRVFDDDNKQDILKIDASKSCSFPISILDQYDVRKTLAWVLADENARRSFESIRKNLMTNVIKQNGYLFWDFGFTPPNLQSVVIETSGRYDEETNSYFVNEITSLTGLKHDFPETIEFFHPKFTQQVKSGEGSKGFVPVPKQDNYSVNDEQEANSETKSRLLKVGATTISFFQPFKVVKKAAAKQISSAGSQDDEEVNQDACLNVSTHESDVFGSVPQADWKTTEDISDDAHLYLNKFTCFQHMLEILAQRYNCEVISNKLVKLRKFPYCTKHFLKDGEPRCMAVVTLRCNDSYYAIFEVDTSDAEKPLSTMLINLISNDLPDNILFRLEKDLLRNTLRWPIPILDESVGLNGHTTIAHPRTTSKNKGVLELESLDQWALRVFSKIQSGIHTKRMHKL